MSKRRITLTASHTGHFAKGQFVDILDKTTYTFKTYKVLRNHGCEATIRGWRRCDHITKQLRRFDEWLFWKLHDVQCWLTELRGKV